MFSQGYLISDSDFCATVFGVEDFVNHNLRMCEIKGCYVVKDNINNLKCNRFFAVF